MSEKALKHRLEYGAFRAVSRVLLALPEGVAQRLGALLGWTAGVLLRIRRPAVDAHLAQSTWVAGDNFTCVNNVGGFADPAELALWRLATESPQADDLRQYLERYPEGRFTDAAEWMIRRRSP